MNIIQEEQLRLEIAHIFESGANEVRVLEMVKSFTDKYYQLRSECEVTYNDSVQYNQAPIIKSEDNDEPPSYTFLPFILAEHTEESLVDYDSFMEEYHNIHACCPKCGSEDCASSLIGYALHWDKKDEYKDLNRCRCIECGDIHTVHERVKFEL